MYALLARRESVAWWQRPCVPLLLTNGPRTGVTIERCWAAMPVAIVLPTDGRLPPSFYISLLGSTPPFKPLFPEAFIFLWIN